MVTEVKEEHLKKALLPILVIGPSKVIEPTPFSYVLLTIFAPNASALLGITILPSVEV